MKSLTFLKLEISHEVTEAAPTEKEEQYISTEEN